MNSKQKGDIALAKAIAYYIEAGYEVLLPIGDKRPYDLVIEDVSILHTRPNMVYLPYHYE
jgi:hypothetical protein